MKRFEYGDNRVERRVNVNDPVIAIAYADEEGLEAAKAAFREALKNMGSDTLIMLPPGREERRLVYLRGFSERYHARRMAYWVRKMKRAR